MQNVTQALLDHLRAWNSLDWVLAASLIISTCSAFAAGLIRSVVSLFGLGVGVLVALLYAPRIAHMLSIWVGAYAVARAAAFLLLLVSVYVAVTLLGRALRGVCHAMGLGVLDRLAGAAFGLLRGILLLAALLLPITPYLQHSAQARSSLLLPYLLRASHAISSFVPRDARFHLPRISR